MALEVIFGNAVTGAQRFSRPNLEARFLSGLAAGSGIKMFGLRRIGKSTLRLYGTEHFDATSRPYLSLDGQGLHSLRDFLGQLMMLLPGEKNLMGRALSFISATPVKAALDAIAKGTDHEEKILSVYWRLVSDGILTALKAGPKPVLIIDEFTYLISNMIKRDDQEGRDDVDKLLASMRQWRGAGMTPLDPSEFDRVFAEHVRPDLHADFYNQFDRRFHAYKDLPEEEQKTLLLPALTAIMEAEADCLHDDIPCEDPWTQVDLALALSMLVDDGFVHFTENIDGRRRWKPASRLAKMWWRRSKLA